jgi:hypothetical protein
MARLPATEASILKAIERERSLLTKHAGRRAKTAAKIEWYGKQLQQKTDATAKQRINIASQLLKDQVKQNISKPVLKYKGIRSGRMQVLPESRSKPGEFPRLETATLMRDIFKDTDQSTGRFRGIVGTTKDYGLLLETRMSRSYLRKTLFEMANKLRNVIVVKPWW